MWNSFIKTINRATAGLAMVFLVMMVVLIFWQIISRAVFGSSFSWTEELARFLMIWVMFLGAGIAFQYGAHISVESFVSRFPIHLQKIVQIIIAALSISLFLILLVKGYEISSKMMLQKSPALKLPMGYVYTIIPISAVLQILNIIDTTKRFCTTGEVVREEV